MWITQIHQAAADIDGRIRCVGNQHHRDSRITIRTALRRQTTQRSYSISNRWWSFGASRVAIADEASGGVIGCGYPPFGEIINLAPVVDDIECHRSACLRRDLDGVALQRNRCSTAR